MRNKKSVSILCVIIAAVMIFNILPLCSAAADAASDGSYVLEKIYKFDGVGGVNDIADSSYFFSINGQAFSESYYDQLNSESKTVYDAVYNEFKNEASGKTLQIPLEKVWTNKTVTLSGNRVLIDSATENSIFAWLRDVVTPAVFALVYDHPELSWLMNTSYYTGYSTTGYSFPYGVTSIKTDIKVVSVVFQLAEVNNDTGNLADITAAVNSAKAVIDANRDEADGMYGLIKAIHDYICDTVSYATVNLGAREKQTAYSAFFGSRSTVCAGYAKGFKVLCDAYSIPCILVSGSGVENGSITAHMWNYVKLGTRWYAIDTTWDDQSIIRYDFFLVGASSIDTHFEKAKFSYTHRPDGQWTSSFNYVFLYPPLSDTEYTHTFGDWVSADDTSHIKTCVTCGKYEKAEHSYKLSKTTAATYDSEGLRTYTCNICNGTRTEIIPKKTITPGDVNLDGRINSMDIMMLKLYIANKATFNDNQKIAANLNGDRRVTSMDLQILKTMLASKS